MAPVESAGSNLLTESLNRRVDPGPREHARPRTARTESGPCVNGG
jgi:hypothetical protein